MQTATLQKATTKGQITLPVNWRRQFGTNQFLVKVLANKLEIFPADIDKISDFVVFDATRDNAGRGIKAKKILKTIKKING